MTSSPLSVATTKAGRFFAALKSENGKGATTTSPFTNAPTPHPLQGDPNRGAAQIPKPTLSHAHLYRHRRVGRRYRAPTGTRQNRKRRSVFPAANAADAHRSRLW